MKISVDFEELNRVLSYVYTILSDKSVEEKVKNVIFIVKDDEVTVIGYNQITFSRTTLEKVTCEDIPESGWEFQIKSSDLNKIMSSLELSPIDKYKEIDEELAKSDINIFKVGNRDLSQVFLNAMTKHEPGEKVYRTRYKLNKNDLFEDFELKKDIFIEEKYLYATFDDKNIEIKRQKSIHQRIKNISELKINQIIDIEDKDYENEEEEDKNDNLININDDDKNNNQNNDILGIEKLPPDDDPIRNPPNIDIVLSDIDMDDEEENEKSEKIENSEIKNEENNIKIINIPIQNETSKKSGDNFEFTEHILN